GSNTPIAQGIDHAATGPIAVRRGDVVSIGAHTVPGEFTINAGTALPGVLVFFEYQYARAFSQHKTVAIYVPGTRGSGGIIVTCGQGAHGCETANPQRRNSGFRAPG